MIKPKILTPTIHSNEQYSNKQYNNQQAFPNNLIKKVHSSKNTPVIKLRYNRTSSR